jgi:hypothetical protein
MIQAFSLIFNFFNIASPCGDMIYVTQSPFPYTINSRKQRHGIKSKKPFYTMV